MNDELSNLQSNDMITETRKMKKRWKWKEINITLKALGSARLTSSDIEKLVFSFFKVTHIRKVKLKSQLLAKVVSRKIYRFIDFIS